MTQQLIGGKFSATYPDTVTGDVKPAVGYLLYTYVSGTTTPKTTWIDSLLTAPNANPVVLNSRGEASIFIGTGAYTIVLKTPGGATVYTTDGVVSVDAGLDAFKIELASATGATRSQEPGQPAVTHFGTCHRLRIEGWSLPCVSTKLSARCSTHCLPRPFRFPARWLE